LPVYSQKAPPKSQFPLCEGQEYPCPCRREAKLVPIYLTDAFGCDRCPQMFVMNDDGHLVEQLTGGYPYARAWRWTGQQWKMLQPRADNSVWSFFGWLLLLLLGQFLFAQHLTGLLQWLYWVIGILVVTFVLPLLPTRQHHRR
jgi:hypothetical protein